MVDDYENKHYSIEAPDPIKIWMEEMQLKQVDLISEILKLKCRLTVDMIRKLTTRLNISEKVLISDYQITL